MLRAACTSATWYQLPPAASGIPSCLVGGLLKLKTYTHIMAKDSMYVHHACQKENWIACKSVYQCGNLIYEKKPSRELCKRRVLRVSLLMSRILLRRNLLKQLIQTKFSSHTYTFLWSYKLWNVKRIRSQTHLEKVVFSWTYAWEWSSHELKREKKLSHNLIKRQNFFQACLANIRIHNLSQHL